MASTREEWDRAERTGEFRSEELRAAQELGLFAPLPGTVAPFGDMRQAAIEWALEWANIGSSERGGRIGLAYLVHAMVALLGLHGYRDLRRATAVEEWGRVVRSLTQLRAEVRSLPVLHARAKGLLREYHSQRMGMPASATELARELRRSRASAGTLTPGTVLERADRRGTFYVVVTPRGVERPLGFGSESQKGEYLRWLVHPDGPPPKHRQAASRVRRELREAGFRIEGRSGETSIFPPLSLLSTRP